jgi:hypothetical protein
MLDVVRGDDDRGCLDGADDLDLGFDLVGAVTSSSHGLQETLVLDEALELDALDDWPPARPTFALAADEPEEANGVHSCA